MNVTPNNIDLVWKSLLIEDPLCLADSLTVVMCDKHLSFSRCFSIISVVLRKWQSQIRGFAELTEMPYRFSIIKYHQKINIWLERLFQKQLIKYDIPLYFRIRANVGCCGGRSMLVNELNKIWINLSKRQTIDQCIETQFMIFINFLLCCCLCCRYCWVDK